MKVNHGLRNCSCGCRGLISGKAYRTKWKSQRQQYYQNKTHIKRKAEKDLKKQYKKLKLHRSPSQKAINEIANYYLKDMEVVFVKQPK